MIADYFTRNFQNPREYLFNDIKITIGINENKLTLFKTRKYRISIMLTYDNEILNNIKNICDFLTEKFLENSYPNKKLSIIANWYVFSSIVNEDIFNKINSKDNVHYKNMKNTFALINNTNGDLFFKPEAVENKVISDRMKFLYKEYQAEYQLSEEKEKLFVKEISHLYQVLETVMRNIR
jgi:hypothetical protein